MSEKQTPPVNIVNQDDEDFEVIKSPKESTTTIQELPPPTYTAASQPKRQYMSFIQALAKIILLASLPIALSIAGLTALLPLHSTVCYEHHDINSTLNSDDERLRRVDYHITRMLEWYRKQLRWVDNHLPEFIISLTHATIQLIQTVHDHIIKRRTTWKAHAQFALSAAAATVKEEDMTKPKVMRRVKTIKNDDGTETTVWEVTSGK